MIKDLLIQSLLLLAETFVGELHIDYLLLQSLLFLLRPLPVAPALAHQMGAGEEEESSDCEGPDIDFAAVLFISVVELRSLVSLGAASHGVDPFFGQGTLAKGPVDQSDTDRTPSNLLEGDVARLEVPVNNALLNRITAITI